MTDTSSSDGGSVEGPDVELPDDGEVPTDDGDQKPGGLGPDGTIPAAPGGLAAGVSDTASNFNPEEDAPEG